MSLSTCSMQPEWKEALSSTERLTGTWMGKNKLENLCQGIPAECIPAEGLQRQQRDGPSWGAAKEWEWGTLEGGAVQTNTWRDRIWHGESHGTPGHMPPLGSHYCQPHFGTFVWSCMSFLQSSISLTAVLFVCFLTALSEVLFNTSYITFITQINFGAFDWKRSRRSSSSPKWQIMPTHYQYSKSKTFPWLQCIHRPKITLCPHHTKHPVCCGHDYFGHFAFPICLKH